MFALDLSGTCIARTRYAMIRMTSGVISETLAEIPDVQCHHHRYYGGPTLTVAIFIRWHRTDYAGLPPPLRVGMGPAALVFHGQRQDDGIGEE
ncbi:MAG: hypothetical protein BGO89_07145 [Candidatus Kapaibacterium thiocyanatum]|uniref:Uncharacterized protein n=1 Tax=Candidatus Kapaibacterium thiocyanatum TaxID=1895771 RepID=A0A1M3KZ30_9BACT|nr:MAG: hypothetical protein BGO89_07145 ['Candidatus Kapabacteria' thiocyanatum]